MTEDTQNQRLREWLQQLGCPVHLSPADLEKLNTPNMRSVWRHLQRHVMPVQSVQTIRKNLLLSKLRTDNILPGKFGKFSVESVHELSQLQNISNTQEEIIVLKDKVNAIDDKLKLATSSLLIKNTEKKHLQYRIKDIKDKTTLLKMKSSRIEKDNVELDKKLGTARCLLIPHSSSYSYSDLNNDKSIITKYVMKHKVSSSGILGEDCISEIIMYRFPATTVYNGIIQVSSQALWPFISRQLDRNILNIKENNKIPGVLPFHKHLNNLNILVIQSALLLQECLDELKDYSIELDKEKKLLIKALQEICDNNEVSLKNYDNEDVSAVQFVETLVKNSIMSKKVIKSEDLKNKLESECSDYDYLKWLVGSLGEKETDLHIEVEKKVNYMNKLITLICNSRVNAVKDEVLQKCTERASNFFASLKLKGENIEELFTTSENMIVKEVEMFQKAPLIAISRKWEERNELLPIDVLQDVLKNPSLLFLLYQSEPKNILKGVLEKLCWYHSINYR